MRVIQVGITIVLPLRGWALTIFPDYYRLRAPAGGDGFATAGRVDAS
jgi:hypothetical protein